ncbi:hypothetical protein PR048_007412 [Dryococelus australis]|uniref:Uncharacterized protein n=1 Tax=Dryococelus australis TaxID=614101 RepID=A0ABQ9HU64_9NEOP|nr:hypothetical protein PR048_007412 [Dryococelus australis]
MKFLVASAITWEIRPWLTRCCNLALGCGGPDTGLKKQKESGPHIVWQANSPSTTKFRSKTGSTSRQHLFNCFNNCSTSACGSVGHSRQARGGRNGVAVRLLTSHPCRTGFDYQRSRPRIFACGNLAGRCRWSEGFLVDLPFPRPCIPVLLHNRLASPPSPLKILKTASGPYAVSEDAWLCREHISLDRLWMNTLSVPLWRLITSLISHTWQHKLLQHPLPSAKFVARGPIKAFSYLNEPPRIRQHRHGSCMNRTLTVNTSQEVIQPIKIGERPDTTPVHRRFCHGARCVDVLTSAASKEGRRIFRAVLTRVTHALCRGENAKNTWVGRFRHAFSEQCRQRGFKICLESVNKPTGNLTAAHPRVFTRSVELLHRLQNIGEVSENQGRVKRERFRQHNSHLRKSGVIRPGNEPCEDTANVIHNPRDGFVFMITMDSPHGSGRRTDVTRGLRSSWRRGDGHTRTRGSPGKTGDLRRLRPDIAPLPPPPPSLPLVPPLTTLRPACECRCRRGLENTMLKIDFFVRRNAEFEEGSRLWRAPSRNTAEAGEATVLVAGNWLKCGEEAKSGAARGVSGQDGRWQRMRDDGRLECGWTYCTSKSARDIALTITCDVLARLSGSSLPVDIVVDVPTFNQPPAPPPVDRCLGIALPSRTQIMEST